MITFPNRAVSIIFNLRKQGNLNLTLDHIVGIYNGTYKRWNHPDLQDVNSYATLPDAEIIVLARKDETSTTEMFTTALSTFDDNWNETYGVFRFGEEEGTLQKSGWSPGVVSYFTMKSFSMIGVTSSLSYSVGYMATCDPEISDIAVANVYNNAGHLTSAELDGIVNSTESIVEQYPWRQIREILYDTTGFGYPMTSIVYFIIDLSNMEDCSKAVQLFRFIQYAMEHTDGQINREDENNGICASHVLLPVSRNLLQKINETLDTFSCKGTKVSLLSQQAHLLLARKSSSVGLVVYVSIGAAAGLVVIIGCTAAYFVRHNRNMSDMISDNDWRVDPHSIKSLAKTSRVMGSRRMSYYVNSETIVLTLVGEVKLQYAKHERMDVMVNVLPTKEFNDLTTKTEKLLRLLKSEIKHENICQFFGLVPLEQELCIVVEFCPLGSVYEMLRTGMNDLDDVFRFSMCTDISTGLCFLHDKNIIHGKVTPHVCYVDAKWTAKIADWQFNSLRLSQAERIRHVHHITSKISDEERVWIAPEMLKHQPPDANADVFGLSMLVTAVFNGGHPCQLSEDPPTAEIMTAVEHLDHFRFPPSIPEQHAEIIKAGLNIQAKARPPPSRILAALHASNPSEKTVMELLFEQMETKTVEIDNTMQKFAKLLNELLPPAAAEKLLNGEPVIPESYEFVTLYLSDIVGFTKLSSKSKPIEVVNLLNELYSSFDTILDKHDVYKLETIGDAYMVISGLPQRNGKLHASHIANMTMDLSWASVNYKIRHLPGEDLRLRMGLHTGPVVAGVVGAKMPRFCLFGYTVTNVEVMESTSVPRKVHMSGTTYEFLTDIGGFDMKLRTVPNPKVSVILRRYMGYWHVMWFWSYSGFSISYTQRVQSLYMCEVRVNTQVNIIMYELKRGPVMILFNTSWSIAT